MKRKQGQQWDRVTGPNLDLDTADLQKANKRTFESEQFKEACEFANIEPTTRQASKFRRKKGIVYKIIKGLV